MSPKGPRLAAAALILASTVAYGCGGSGGGSSTFPQLSSPPTASAPSPMSSSSPSPSATNLDIKEGAIVGLDDQFSPVDGDTASGGAGQTVDGVLCKPVMFGAYHVHIWLGIYVNGTQYAMADAVGMKDPGNENSFGVTNTASCFYYLHTHDASGLVHVEDPQSVPLSTSLFTLKTLFDIWGITVNSSQFGQFAGPVRVYTSGQFSRAAPSYGPTVPASSYTQWSADPNTIPIYSREVIIFEVGPTYPVALPSITFPYEH